MRELLDDDDESHVTTVCMSAVCHLRNIAWIMRYLTHGAAEQIIVHALVTSRLDVGNALLDCIANKYNGLTECRTGQPA